MNLNHFQKIWNYWRVQRKELMKNLQFLGVYQTDQAEIFNKELNQKKIQKNQIYDFLNIFQNLIFKAIDKTCKIKIIEKIKQMIKNKNSIQIKFKPLQQNKIIFKFEILNKNKNKLNKYW